MFHILAFGITALISAARYAYRGVSKPTGFLLGMCVATLFVTLAGVCSNFKAVFDYLAHDPPKDGVHFAQIFCEGMSESLNTCIMGFIFLAMTAVVTAYGMSRADRQNRDLAK